MFRFGQSLGDSPDWGSRGRWLDASSCVPLRDLSSYKPVLSESRSSPLCPVLVLSLKVAWGPAGRNTALGVVCLEGSVAKMGHDEARSPLGAPRVELHSRGCWSGSRRIDSPPLHISARRWWESVQLIPSGGCVTSRIWVLTADTHRQTALWAVEPVNKTTVMGEKRGKQTNQKNTTTSDLHHREASNKTLLSALNLRAGRTVKTIRLATIWCFISFYNFNLIK